MSSGNSDANSYNVGFDLKYDPKTKNVLKFGGLYLRSDSNGETTCRQAHGLRPRRVLLHRPLLRLRRGRLPERRHLPGRLHRLAERRRRLQVRQDGHRHARGLRRFRRRVREVRGAGRHLERRLPRGRGVLLEDLAHRRLHAEGLGPLEVERHRRRLLPLRRRLHDLALEDPRAEARVPPRPQDPARRRDAREDRHGLHRGRRREVLVRPGPRPNREGSGGGGTSAPPDQLHRHVSSAGGRVRGGVFTAAAARARPASELAAAGRGGPARTPRFARQTRARA